MSYEMEDLVGRLPRADAKPETIARVRGLAHEVLVRGRRTPGRARVRAARIYGEMLEPVLLMSAIAISLGWALSRIIYIIG